MLDSIFGYWPLAANENSGGGSISTALTGVNGPTFEPVAGFGAMAKLVAASNQHFTLASQDWTGVSKIWVYCVARYDTTANMYLISQHGAGVNRTFGLRTSAASVFSFTVYDDADVAHPASSPFIAAAGSTIYHIFAWADMAAQVIGIEVNGAVALSAIPTATGLLNPSTAPFQVGTQSSSTVTDHNGNIARVTVGKDYIPTPEERLIWRRRITQGYTPSNMPLNRWWKQQQAL